MSQPHTTSAGFRKLLALLTALYLLAPSASFAQKKTSQEELTELDNLINNPFSKGMLTDRTYRKSLFKDQQAIGGSIIKEGRAVGTSATLDEKSVTVNVGLPMWIDGLSLQPTFKGSSSDGFVKVFDGDGYGRSLGGGLNVLYFFKKTNKSVYKEDERIKLHRKLRQLRYSNEGVYKFKTETFDTPVGATKWVDATTPTDASDFKSKTATKLTNFITARDNFFTELEKLPLKDGKTPVDRYFSNDLDETINNDPLKSAYISYIQAYEAIKDLIPEFWGLNTKFKEDKFIQDSLKTESRFHISWLNHKLKNQDETLRKNRLAFYDTVQLKANWIARNRTWISANFLWNETKQSVFNSSKVKEAFKEDRYDGYFTAGAGLNWLQVRRKVKYYISAGATFNNMRVFSKDSLQTYQTTTIDSINNQLVTKVVQSEIYPNMPDKVVYGGFQFQASTYLIGKVGLDLTFKATTPMGSSEQENQYAATFGIFVPIQAGESTLLLMPQVKWDTLNEDNSLTFGFNLSASIPGFVTKADK